MTNSEQVCDAFSLYFHSGLCSCRCVSLCWSWDLVCAHIYAIPRGRAGFCFSQKPCLFQRKGPDPVQWAFNLWLQIPSKMGLLFCLLEVIWSGFVCWNAMAFKPRAACGCWKYSCLQVEDAQESACLVVFSCQSREILEDRPTIKSLKKYPNVLRSVICDRLFLTCLLLCLFPRIWRREETCLCMFTATFLWQIFWKYRLDYLRLEIIAQALNLVQE